MNESLDWLRPDELATANGEGVRVLIIDSGVDAAHPDLLQQSIATYRTQPNARGGIEVVCDESTDVFGHGTAVASILRKHAPGASLSSLRVLGGDLRSSSNHVLRGIAWGIEQKFDVINCSFGTPNDAYLGEYKRLVDLAFVRNVLLVGACNNVDFRKTDYPGSFPTVISTDAGPSDGPDLSRRMGQLVEFVAPGQNIRVAWTNGQHRVSTGSSYAAPFVAALVTRIRQLRRPWNACDVKAQLYRFCAIDV